MKKVIILIPLLMAFVWMQAQSIRGVDPGRTVAVSSLDVTAIGGSDTAYKFSAPEGMLIYAIQTYCTDTLEPDDTIYSRFYGSIDGANWYAVSDTIQLDSTNYPCVDYWSGSSFGYPFGKVVWDKPSTATDGDVGLIIWYIPYK